MGLETCVRPNLKRACLASGIDTVSRLAEVAGVSASAMSRIVRGIRNPNRRAAIRVAKAVGITVLDDCPEITREDLEWLFQKEKP